MTEGVRDELIIFLFITGYSRMNNAMFYSKRINKQKFSFVFRFIVFTFVLYCCGICYR